MEYSFRAYGHPNILSTHKTTLEITKDKELSRRGDCVIGVNSDFSLEEIKKFLKFKKIKLVIEFDNLKEGIIAEINPKFNDDKEIVIRKGEFCSERTLGVRCDRASSELNRNFVNKLKDKNQEMKIKLAVID